MKKQKMIITLFLCALILYFAALPKDSYGIEIIDDGLSEIEIPTAPENSIEELNYSRPPVNVYVFIHVSGHDPFFGMTVNTEDCIEGHLYAFDKNTGIVTAIVQQVVKSHTETKDHVYYVTDNGIYQTDYAGGIGQFLYGIQNAEISCLDYFDGILYFIENGDTVVAVNVESGTSSVVLEESGMSWVYFFDDDKLVWRNWNGDPFYYVLGTELSISLNSEYEFNCILAPYVTPQVDTSASTLSVLTGEFRNDVNFPFDEYPAEADNVGKFNFDLDNVVSYFSNTINYDPITGKRIATCHHDPDFPNNVSRDCKYYAKVPECDGFAKYAHERFIHITGNANSNPYQPTGDTNHTDQTIQNAGWLETFFGGLSRGAFVRYGKYKTELDENGNPRTYITGHSIAFDYVDVDNGGIWVYECNQDWKCGVFYSFYTFDVLAGNYSFIDYYVNHTFSETPVIDDLSYHLTGCINCDGYLRQTHVGSASYSYFSASKHTVSRSCCQNNELEDHLLLLDNTCVKCGYVDDYIGINRISSGSECLS